MFVSSLKYPYSLRISKYILLSSPNHLYIKIDILLLIYPKPSVLVELNLITKLN